VHFVGLFLSSLLKMYGAKKQNKKKFYVSAQCGSKTHTSIHLAKDRLSAALHPVYY